MAFHWLMIIHTVLKAFYYWSAKLVKMIYKCISYYHRSSSHLVSNFGVWIFIVAILSRFVCHLTTYYAYQHFWVDNIVINPLIPNYTPKIVLKQCGQIPEVVQLFCYLCYLYCYDSFQIRVLTNFIKLLWYCMYHKRSLATFHVV